MPASRATRQAWVVWITAVVVYLFAVFHRSSLGVAGLAAADRFGVGPAALSTFTVLQVFVYAAMQVPTGLLVDRFGPRKLLTAAAIFMGLGQILFAIADSYPLGLIARGVLGLGDAMTWVSVLRLIGGHFPARKYAVVMSLSAMIGSAGNLVATVPLTLLLHNAGWTMTFLVAGAATAVYATVAATRLRDLPHGVPAPVVERVTPREVVRNIANAWRTPGTRLGFWVHFSTMVAPTTLGLLWGVPYLVQAQGLSVETAGSVLSLLVIGGLILSPVVGTLISRNPELRVPLAAAYLVTSGAVWTLLLIVPGRLPLWLLVIAFALFAVGGPASSVGFALAKDYNPNRIVGTATGVVNVGGFVATTIAALAVGVLLGLAEGLGQQNAFRIAFVAVLAVQSLGTWRMAIWWRRARAVVLHAAARGEEVPVQLQRRRWDEVIGPAAA
ncbi:MFS transporter [Kutzneria chonburiensis]|uniref:Nitrate/nitrite transporter n=1 Tax=Kutzneria chonburiensis TaxID=1483604 RepID=A0ABV6MXS2_9PSEU|nr:MFS transporter [Kutzneria chonburiensis]